MSPSQRGRAWIPLLRVSLWSTQSHGPYLPGHGAGKQKRPVEMNAECVRIDLLNLPHSLLSFVNSSEPDKTRDHVVSRAYIVRTQPHGFESFFKCFIKIAENL